MRKFLPFRLRYWVVRDLMGLHVVKKRFNPAWSCVFTDLVDGPFDCGLEAAEVLRFWKAQIKRKP